MNNNYLKPYGKTAHALALEFQAETKHLVDEFLANSYEEVIYTQATPVKIFKTKVAA